MGGKIGIFEKSPYVPSKKYSNWPLLLRVMNGNGDMEK